MKRNINQIHRTWIVALLAGWGLGLLCHAAPERIAYQGRLVNGTNLVNGVVSMEVALYPTVTGGVAVFAETQSVQVVDGLYTFTLGASTAPGALRSALTNPAVFLELTVDGNTLSPREQLGSVAYALSPDGHSLDAADGSPQDVVHVNDSGFVGVNRSSPITASEVFGLHKETTTYGGMYISTAAGGFPFYGYAVNGTGNAWHYVDPDSGIFGKWKLNAPTATRMTVDLDSGDVGIGTTAPSERLDVNGSVRIRGGSPAAGKVLTSLDGTGKAVWSDGGTLDQLMELLNQMDPDKEIPSQVTHEVSCAANPFSFSVSSSSIGTVVGFVGRETISQPYRFRVVLEGVSSAINPEAQIGQAAELQFSRNGKLTRYVGEVSSFAVAGVQGGGLLAVVEFAPSAHRLALEKDYEIFKETEIPNVINQVYTAAGLNSAFLDDSSLSGTYDSRAMVVQYGETDLSFVSRLMEEWGIFYFFEQLAGGEVMHLADSNGGFITLPGSPFSYHGHQADPPVATDETVRSIQNLTAQSSQDFLVRDHDPVTDLTPSASASLPAGSGQNYNFASSLMSNSEASILADILKNRKLSGARPVLGSSTIGDLAAGSQFSMVDATGNGLNETYNLTSVTHVGMRMANGTCFAYGNEFTALPDVVNYRPPKLTPVPRIPGLESAIVTGAPGEDIHVDEHGRIKVKFHWDTHSASDDSSSGWVPVLQNEHSFFLPRVGNEVAVAFLNGDPDRPIVVGRVMNDSEVPYSLPSNKTRTVIKTSSTPTGGGSNEIRLEDQSGSEEMYLSTSGDLIQNAENDISLNAAGAVTVTSGNDVNFDSGTLVVDVDNGRVGIGDTSPENMLELRSSDTQTALLISNDATDGDAAVRFRFGSSTQFTIGVDDTDDHYKISDGSSFASNNRLVVHGSTGNVGVKRVPTAYPFEVQGSAGKTDGSTLWLVISDRDMKDEISPITDSLERLDGLAPVSYRYNEDYRSTYGEVEDKKRYGFIAQEYGKVFPDDVRKDSGTGYFTMDAGSVIPHLVAAVKELKTANEQLRKDVENLKQQKAAKAP